MKSYFPDTIVAQSTAVGEAAIGVIRLSGPRSREILSKIFISKKKVDDFSSHHFYLGKIIDPETNEILDQAMVVWMQSPHSFTGEEMAEIHCHGSPYLMCRVLHGITTIGIRLAEPGEFSKRAYLNGKIDLSQAEAVADLIHSQNEWAAKNALRQMDGYLSKTIGRLREKSIHALANLEAGFDFSEEDVWFVTPHELKKMLTEVQNEIQGLLDSFQTGQIYKEGLKVALIGKPNVGKSSLLNALLKEEKAIAHEDPGTTRDVISGERKIRGIQTIFYDTAGIRKSCHPVEQEGIKRSQQTFEKSDLVLLLLDSSRELTKEDDDLLKQLGSRKAIIIYSKCDLPPKWNPRDLQSRIPGVFYFGCQFVSAQTQQGIPELIEGIYELSIAGKIKNAHNYVLNNVRHKVSLEKINGGLKELIGCLDHNKMDEECLAEELRIICRELGGITGELDNEQVLDEVFSKFCIGK